MKRGEAVHIDIQNLNFPLFRNLSSENLNDLAALIHQKSFSAGTTIMTAEQTGEVVYFILSGTVKVHIEQEDGGDVIVAILGPGEIIGEMSALDQTSRSAGIDTIENSNLLWLDRSGFQRCLKNMPMLAYNLCCIIANRLRHANEKIQTLATQSVEGRVARQILEFSEQYGTQNGGGDTTIAVRLTQGDIAALIGASREHTNRVIVSYKERGYISIDKNYRITVHDHQALARRC